METEFEKQCLSNTLNILYTKDILLEICKYLQTKDIVKMEILSRYHYSTMPLFVKRMILKTPINIKKYKNIEILRDFSGELKDVDIKDLPLRKLDCVWNTNFTDEGIKNLPLQKLYCGWNKNFTNEGIKKLPLQKLYCGLNQNFTDERIKNLPLQNLDCGLNRSFTD